MKHTSETVRNGIYHVRFASPSGHGEGIIVFQNGSINGGDAGYVFLGKVKISRGQVSGKILARRWNPDYISAVVGPVESLTLKLGGYYQEGATSFDITGTVQEHPPLSVRILGRFLSDLA